MHLDQAAIDELRGEQCTQRAFQVALARKGQPKPQVGFGGI